MKFTGEHLFYLYLFYLQEARPRRTHGVRRTIENSNITKHQHSSRYRNWMQPRDPNALQDPLCRLFFAPSPRVYLSDALKIVSTNESHSFPTFTFILLVSAIIYGCSKRARPGRSFLTLWGHCCTARRLPSPANTQRPLPPSSPATRRYRRRKLPLRYNSLFGTARDTRCGGHEKVCSRTWRWNPSRQAATTTPFDGFRAKPRPTDQGQGTSERAAALETVVT